MKSLKINMRIVFITLISALISSSIYSAKLRKQSKVGNNLQDANTNTTYINPRIDNNRKIRGNDPVFEKVTYVSQLSAGGKAALEMQESGEYYYNKLVLNIRNF